KLCDEIYEKYSLDFNSVVKRMPIFIPHLRGSGPPIRSTSSKVMIYGLTDQSTDSDILFSMIAGLCFELKQLIYVYEQHLKADILQAEIIAYKDEESVAKGAAMLSAWKQGLKDKFQEAEVEIYTPKVERVKVFHDFYQKYYLPAYNLKNHLEGKDD